MTEFSALPAGAQERDGIVLGLVPALAQPGVDLVVHRACGFHRNLQ